MRGKRNDIRCVINENDYSPDLNSFEHSTDYSEYDVTSQEYVVVVKDNNTACRTFLVPDPEVDATIDKCHIQLLVDTGARITIVSYDKYSHFWHDKCLLPPDVLSVAFEGSRINLLGYFWAEISIFNKVIKGKVYVAKRGINVLDLIHQAEFGVTIKPGLPNPVFIEECNIPHSMSSPSVPVCNILNDKLWELKFKKVFEDRLGKITNFQHFIKVKDGITPVKHKLRNVPLSIREDLSKHLKSLCEQGIIEKVESTLWISPIVLARKRSDDLRMCVDLRSLNQAIWVDGFPLPRIEDLIAKVGSSTWFSKFDLKAAYHQIELHPLSRHLTAFVTPDGVFQFRRLPFGLASAAAVFQRIMSEMFEELSNVVVFQDDILIFTQSEDEHDKVIDQVFHILEHRGVTLQKSKCVFKTREVEYLGHIISENGIRPRSGLVKSIIEAPAPSNKEQLLAFLGLCEFYSKFMRDYAKTTECFRLLLKKGATFSWSDECEKGFQLIKKHITNAPALQPFNGNRETIVTVDACEYGLGAVLSQMAHGKEFTVGFASRTLRPVERKYSVIEKELLACTWSVEKFKSYLWGRSFILQTDHRPLVDILSGRNINRTTARLARLSTKLLEFNFKAVYIPGGKNRRADCLSRLPLQVPDENEETDIEECFVANISQTSVSFAECDWIKAVENDAILKDVISFIKKGWPKERTLSPELQIYWKINPELSLENGKIVRGDKFIPPSVYREKIITDAHSGHLGATITKRNVRSNFWWPKMDNQIIETIKLCSRCNTSDKVLILEGVSNSVVPPPARAWQKIGLDFLGPFHVLPNTSKYFLVLVDHLSRWVEVEPINIPNSKNVIDCLSRIFLREGCPEEILTDNGVQFISKEMSVFLNNCCIKHTRTPLYHPQSNGKTERFNRVIVECVQAAFRSNNCIFQAVKDLIWSYRISPHVATGFSPFELMRGRKACSQAVPFWMVKSLHRGCDLEAVWECANKKSSSSLSCPVEPKRESFHNIHPGDWVRIKNPVIVKKGFSKFLESQQVVDVRKNAVKLSNGNWWSTSRVAKDPSRATAPSFKIDVDNGLKVDSNVNADNCLRRSSRAIVRPNKYRDFI
ncbi:gypsy retrotransposon integrase-like protein 1 [Lissotriton helveticus]